MVRFVRLPGRLDRWLVTPLLAVIVAGGGCRQHAVTSYGAPNETPRTAAAGSATGALDGARGALPPAQRPAGGAQLEWDKPAAWSEQPPSQMRLASYAFVAA